MDSPDQTGVDQTAAPDGDLHALKELLFRDEIRAIAELREQVDEAKLEAQDLAKILPKAVRRADHDGLGRALQPTISEAFQEAVKKNPQSLVDAISPIMGPAISAAISNAIRGMIQSFNKTLEYSLSAKGLRWRWEAFRTGKPFGEVVLLNVLEYRVERTFLIHREDGILLAEFANQEAPEADADLVSGMLTALRDLGRDSLGAEDHEGLDKVDFGHRELWLEHGKYATLVAVILGHAPVALRKTMREAIDNIHVEFAESLRTFDGDTSELADTEQRMEEWKSIFSEADEHLETCTITRFRDNLDTGNGWIWKWAFVVPLLLVGVVSIWGLTRWHRASQIAQALHAPDSVDWRFKNKTLTLTGSAHHEWIENATTLAGALPFVDAVESSELVNLDANWLLALAELRNAPGLVVVEAHRTEDGYQLAGLRDLLAVDPDEVLRNAGVPVDQVQASWTTFRSLDREMVTARLQNRLPLGADVDWLWQDGILHVTGSASGDWLNQARLAASDLSGELQIDLSEVSQIDDPHRRRLHQAWLSAVAELTETPGIHVTRADETSQGYRLEGLRDPLSVEPDTVLAQHGLNVGQVKSAWTPFNSREPALVAQRFQRHLPESPTVDWAWEDGVLIARGNAPHAWLEQAKMYANLMRDDIRVDLRQVEDVDAQARDRLRAAIESIQIQHDPGQTGLAADQLQKLEEVRDLVRQLRETCELMRCLPQVVIVGYADGRVPSNQVMSMSIARARSVWQILGQVGLSDDYVIVKGMGNPPIGQNRSGDSLFKVNFLGLPTP